MNRIAKTIVAVALFVTFGGIQAQEVSPVDFLRTNPYQMKSNPAVELPYNSVMSLLVGNVGLDFQNPSLKYNNLFDFDAQGRPVTVNLDKFANSLNEDNALRFSMNENLFTLFHRLEVGMLTFGYDVRVQGDMHFNDGLFSLLANGNAAFVGENNPVKRQFGLQYYRFPAICCRLSDELPQALFGGRSCQVAARICQRVYRSL